jgi:hypothetical protein
LGRPGTLRTILKAEGPVSRKLAIWPRGSTWIKTIPCARCAGGSGRTEQPRAIRPAETSTQKTLGTARIVGLAVPVDPRQGAQCRNPPDRRQEQVATGVTANGIARVAGTIRSLIQAS